MRTTHAIVALALAMPVLAQTAAQPAAQSAAQPAAKTEKLWKIEAVGLTGWGAAGEAQRVGLILKQEKGIKNLIFDTCGVGYFEVRKGYEPDIATLNEMLQKKHIAKGVKITSCAETDVPVAAEVFELSIRGLGWAATASETRAVLSQLEGVQRVHPFGATGKALVFLADKDKLTEAIAAKALLKGTKELRLGKMERVKV